ncbi:hypothetical protein ACA910_015817 [Epithemia clementina (nom. ined.)]
MTTTMSTKNSTRLASLMGTWTTWADTKASIGNYHVMAYFVVHLMPDPMADYSCQLPDCVERDNRICQRQGVSQPGENLGKKKETLQCQNVQDVVSDWSDVAAFYYIGFHVHAGIPFRVEKVMDTGGWIGPYNLVMAQDLDNSNGNSKTTAKFQMVESSQFKRRQQKDEDVTTDISRASQVVDRYRARYVETLSTPSLSRHIPLNNSLVMDWDSVMGSTAVDTTRHRQATLHHGDNAYERYQGSCDSGNLQPILPLYSFEFRQNDHAHSQQHDEPHLASNGKNDNSNQEDIVVEVDYQLLITPRTHNTAYKYMPWIQKEIRREKDLLGFTVDGPFCYGDDPNRAYTISISMNSEESKKYSSGLRIERGCIEGLPCLPPAALGPNSANTSSPSMIHPSRPAVLDVSKLLYQVGFWSLLLLWLVTFCCIKCCRSEKEEDLGEVNHEGHQQLVANTNAAEAEQQMPLVSSAANGDDASWQHQKQDSREEFVDCIDGGTDDPLQQERTDDKVQQQDDEDAADTANNVV